MSDVQKPVEEQPAAPAEAEAVVEPTTETKAEDMGAPAVEEPSTAVEPVKDEEPVAATEAPVATAKAATPKKEFTGEGVLGYKAPGNFVRKLIFQKKHFWFGGEPVEPKSLASYLRGEKPEIANHNAAWSSQTGKGLLYFSKNANEKATPAGIINLADISDITEDGVVEFFFHMHGAKHVFQAGTLTERESWVGALKTKTAEAKEMAEGIKSSESYKEQHSSLSKPAAVVPTAAISKEPEAKEEKAEAKEEKKEEKTRKSRSASRKRNSIFGNFLGSKKDEQAEPKEEKKVEPKEEAPTETTESTAAPLDGPAVTAADTAPIVEEPAKTETVTPAPAETPKPTNKRNSSIFGTLSSKFGPKKSVSEAKPSSEVAPAVPAKDVTAVEPVSSEAPVIPAPEASEPLDTAVQSPTTAPTTEVTNGVTDIPEEAKPEVKPETKAEVPQKRKSSLPFGLGMSKEKAAEADGEKPKSSSPFAKLRQTIKGKSSPKAAEKAAEKTPEKAEEKATEPTAETSATATEAAETAAEPVISEPISAAPAAAPQVSATA